ncbi:MAG: hypothetical protein U1F60_10665 [Planctomycetota bacterium]
MQDQAVTLRKLGERALARNGELPLALLLELLVPVRRLRELARDHGLTPKGGFRLEKAPAHVLAPLLAELRDTERLDSVLRALVPAPAVTRPVDDPEVGAAESAELRQLLALRDAELLRLRDEAERARQATVRANERQTTAAHRIDQLEQELGRLQRELREQASAAASVAPATTRDERELLRRLHDLENEREAFLAAHEALRRQQAFDQSRVRELEQAVHELDALLPKGKKRRRPPPPEPEPERRFLLPRFTTGFYKSLEGKDQKAVARAFQAVLLFCTEGHGYPGLEVKQLGGQDTWSLRASLGLRVYFRPLGDGEIELLELGDREDQNTTLRRLKER